MPDSWHRALVLLSAVGLWILVLLVRLVDLQVVKHDDFVKRARRQQERTFDLPPWRGTIYDAEGHPLAVTALADSVFAIPSDVVDPHETAAVLAPLLGIPARDLERKLASAEKDFVWLARRVPESAAVRISEKRLPGVKLWKESTRRYPEGSLAASILGYVGADNQGLAGLEYRYDSEVKGRPGRVTLMRDAAQRTISPGTAARAGGADGGISASVADGLEGASLVLTLRTGLQHAVERELARTARERGCRSGSAVVLDPSTGAVLALASYPPFDPNRYGDFDAEVRRCRPIADAYEPGSTFKIVAASAALDTGTVGPEDAVDCGNGALTIGTITIHEHGMKAWSVLSLGDVLAYSSNIGIAHVALGLGRGPFSRSLKAFGFGQKTGIELDGESSGLLADSSSWSALTLPSMSFGQEIGVTVLQMARAYAAVANGGLLPVPYLVAEIRRSDGQVQRFGPKPAQRVMSERTARVLRRFLTRVVEMGTGKQGAIPGFTAAGKTGTAQKAVPGGGYSKDKYVASFIGFTPAEAPRAVIAVVLDEPKGKHYGGDVAAPVFSAIGSELLRVLRVPASDPERVNPSVLIADLARGSATATASVWTAGLVPASNRSRERAAGEEPGAGDGVPDLTGRSARDAIHILARHGLVARLTGTGFVVSQDPPPGAAVTPGTTCTLVLAVESAPLVPAGDTVLAGALRDGVREVP